MSESSDKPDPSLSSEKADPPASDLAAPAPATPAEEASAEPLVAAKNGPLKDAWTALEQGDHVRAREFALELSKSSDALIRKEAEEFLERMKPDPMILLVLLGTAVLIAFLAVQYLGPRSEH